MSERSAKQRYRDAKAIATAALELEPTRRQAFVEQRCARDEALRREVEWLIDAAEDDAEDEVPESFQAAARSALQDVSLEVPLPRNYRLLKRIGQGGMGIVYLAERVDGNLRQPVAFKLLHLSEADNELVARRFSAERGILSRLNHPRIARLIDGGVTAEGRPFMATEFVDGVRIDEWARRGPSRAAVIELFIKVCDAVDYAHRHMVIHRDLKPANIMVSESGEPKLLDFGVARLLDVEDQPGEGGGQALTLAYASPEQIRGEGLSAATDVYSLGVLLYELLAGESPFGDDAAPETLRRRVLAGEYPAPCSRDGRRLSADLAAIVDRAVQLDESLRYESVRALADDLRRFQSQRPVAARAGGAVYRARRFAARHRVGLALSLLAGGILVAFLVDREMQLDRIAWERDRAEAVTDFMSGLLSGADSLPARGNDVTVREILDLGASRLTTAEHDNPAALAQMFVAVGEAYNALGLGEHALPLLEDALGMLEERLPAGEQALIQAELGAAYDSAGRAAESIAADQRAIELLESTPGEHGSQLLRLRIRKLRNQANVLDRAPESVIEELEGIIDTLSAGPEGDAELLFEARSAIVGARVAAGQGDAALADAVRARELAETLYGPGDPRRLRGRYVHATALMLSDPQAAVAMFESLIDDHERLVGPSQRLANTIGNLGVALSRLGRTEESMASFERAAAMIEEAVGRDHYLYRLSVTNLAALRLRVGRPAEAESLLREILPGLERRHARFGGIETFYWASTLEVLGGAQVMQGRLADAAESYRQALQSLSDAKGGDWSGLQERIRGKLDEVDRELSRS
ncbi:protein kinase domain-containing protein [Wenzhouxiangella sp. EGI_FJ10409]|uniref:protein kinase domain-containing protein n=1 Tax=Wenzhouxiangella sp. EGI_FJ10409 TaxID=3243767 RepID=UPI0035DB4F2A